MKKVLVVFISDLSGILIHSKVLIILKFLTTNVIDVSLLSKICQKGQLAIESATLEVIKLITK